MIPFCTGNAVLTSILGQSSNPQAMNDDLDWYLNNAPAKATESWPMRLLPGFVRTPLKARIAARKYEETLIAMWETSPHLLDDIGVVLSTGGILPEHLVAAPARVIEHVKACAAEAAAVPQLDQTPAVPTPAPAARIQMRKLQAAMPIGVPA